MAGKHCESGACNGSMAKGTINDTHIMQIWTNSRIKNISSYNNFSRSRWCFIRSNNVFFVAELLVFIINRTNIYIAKIFSRCHLSSVVNNFTQTYPLPTLRNLKRHFIRYTHWFILADFLIRQVIGSSIILHIYPCSQFRIVFHFPICYTVHELDISN